MTAYRAATMFAVRTTSNRAIVSLCIFDLPLLAAGSS